MPVLRLPGIINSIIPNHHWDCRWWRGRKGKYLIAAWETSHLVLFLAKRFKYRLLSCITTEVVKRSEWSSGLRKRSPGSVTYHMPATVQWSLSMSSVRECSPDIIRRRMPLFCGDSLLCVLRVLLFYNFLSNDVRHEGVSIFLYIDN